MIDADVAAGPFTGYWKRLAVISLGMHIVISLISLVMSALILLKISSALMSGSQRYDDLVVGEIAFADAYKHGDIVASFAAVSLFFVLWLCVSLAVTYSKIGLPDSVTDKNGNGRSGYLPSFLFFAYFLGVATFSKASVYYELAVCFVIGFVCLLWRTLFLRYAPRQLDRSIINSFVAAGGFFFSMAAIAVACRFFSPRMFPSLYPSLLWAGYATVAILFLLLVFLRQVEPFLPRAALYSQLVLPLLCLAPFTRVYDVEGAITGNMVPLFTKLFAVAVLVLLSSLCVRAVIRAGNAGFEQSGTILISTVISIGLFREYHVPAFFEKDLFHMGEKFLAWHQIFEKGQFPYSEFAMARGFFDAVPGLLNKVFFDGTYATFGYGSSLYSAFIYGALTALLISMFIGKGWGVVFALSGIGGIGGGHLQLVLITLLILAQPRLVGRPLVWLFVWCLMMPLLCLYHATSGIAVCVASVPVAICMLSVSFRDGLFVAAWQARRALFSGCFLFLAVVLVSFLPMLLAWGAYIIEQGQSNEVAHGTILLRAMRIPDWFRWNNRWAWESYLVGGWFVSMGLLWGVAVKLIAGFGGKQTGCSGESRSAVPGAIFALLGVLSIVASIPYIMGRIDSNHLSRTGVFAIFGLAVFAMILIYCWDKRSSVSVCCALYLLGAATSSIFSPRSVLASKIIPPKVTSEFRWFDGASFAPLLGETYFDMDTLGNVTTLKMAFGRILKEPGDTYLDLTNHIGYYYIFDLKVPAAYAGYYTSINEKAQNRVINALEANPPPLVLAGPPRTFGSGTAALRSYRVYRWLMKKGYLPLSVNGWSFLVREDRYRQMKPLPTRTEQIRDCTAIFADGYFGGIPAAWGKNMKSLAPRFSKSGPEFVRTSAVHSFQPAQAETPSVPLVTYEFIANRSFSGMENDFLMLRLNSGLNSKSEEAIRIFLEWSDADGAQKGYQETNSVELNGVIGTPLLIPVGAHPAWLLSTSLNKIKVHVAGGVNTFSLALEQPHLLSLVK